MNLHPDDLLLFQDISQAMRRVAKAYDLPLTTIEPFPMPEYRTSPLGNCSSNGTIKLVLRGMTAGVFDINPRREQDVWNTAAHELAHLRHLHHGPAFQAFEVEMQEAIANQRESYTEKLLAKLVKLQNSREGEAQLGNTAAAEAFAGMINKLLIDNELNASDVDYARAADHDPVVEISCTLEKYGIQRKKTRIAWQESLARIVAKAHLCTFLIRTGSNSIIFVGTKSHATVAEYVYGTLVPVIVKMAKFEEHKHWRECKDRNAVPEHYGFMAAWINAFVNRIAERFATVRREAIHETSGSTALIRLEGALVKTQTYMDDKFGRKRRYASALHSRDGQHPEGQARGRAAADRVTLGQRGVTTRTQRLLK